MSDVRSTLSIGRNEIDSRDPTLRITPDGGNPYTVLLVQRMLNIGSESRQDIQITAPGMVPFHARLVQEQSNYRVFDLTEFGGVLVNGAPIEGSRVLHDGDTLRLQDKTQRGVTLMYSNPVERAMGSETVGQTYPLDRSPYIIGRDPAAALQLSGLAISWHHARIDGQPGAHTLTDLGSTNGTFVNDRKISGAYRLHPDDVIRIDQILLVYKGPALMRQAATQRLQMDGATLEMTYRTGFPRRALNTMRNVSISIQPKEFVAIIGGSGSSKSTLLRALNGANRATGGKVLINGNDMYENYEIYQPVIGYVPQSDIVQDSLTVYQSLKFGARLRFPNEPEASREERIERVLDSLELTDFKERLVGRLSGGQKKRVSIALELMAEPALLFMDEPSSGLDPGLDKSMMDTLRRLADRGHIVVIVTHTTLNIDLCDQLAFMARGNLTYFGPPREALDFFGARDYSEIYNLVQQSPVALQQAKATGGETVMFKAGMAEAPATKEKITPDEAAKQWAEKYRATPQYAKYVMARQNQGQQSPQKVADSALSNKRLSGSRRGTFMQQARVLTNRTIALVRRDMRTIISLLLVLPLVGLFLGLISLDPIEGGRGQMLVSRLNQDLLADKLPKQPVTAKPPDSAQAGTTKAQDNSRPPTSIGMFTPASEAQRLLFMMSLAVTLFGIFAAAYTIVTEKSLFLRERMVNLRIAPYLVSKAVVYGALAIFSCLLLLITFSLGVRLPDKGVLMWGPLEIFITIALTAFAGVSIGILLSAISKQVNAVTYAVLGILFVQILFPGVLFDMKGPLEVLSRMTVTRWSLEALGSSADMVARDSESMIVVDSVAVNRKGQPIPGAPPARSVFPAPPSLSVTYPRDAGGLLIRWGALVGFSALFLIGAGLALNRNESF